MEKACYLCCFRSVVTSIIEVPLAKPALKILVVGKQPRNCIFILVAQAPTRESTKATFPRPVFVLRFALPQGANDTRHGIPGLLAILSEDYMRGVALGQRGASENKEDKSMASVALE